MSALTLGMDANRDLHTDRFGNLVTKTDEEAMADYLTQRLSSLVEEFRFNKQRGVPYMTTIYATGRDAVPALRASMLDIVAQTEHVLGIAYLDITFDGDDLKFELSVATEYGQVALRV